MGSASSAIVLGVAGVPEGPAVVVAVEALGFRAVAWPEGEVWVPAPSDESPPSVTIDTMNVDS